MSDPASSASATHAKAIIGGVVRGAVRDAGAQGIVLLEAATPEGRLAGGWLRAALGAERVVDAPAAAGATGTIDAEEHGRAEARILARRRGLLLAHPACKTVLLLSDAPPPERLLPFGDVYATQLEAWAGGLTLPGAVQDMAEQAGGLAALDAALGDWLEGRNSLEIALAALPPAGRSAVAGRLRLNRALRRWPRCVPKLGTRTLWIDVFA